MFAERSSIVVKQHMRMRKTWLCLVAVMVLASLLAGCSDDPGRASVRSPRIIVTSDTILSDMVTSLLPAHRYSVAAILPPGQCPGHYDVKLKDIEKMKTAALNVSFTGLSFMDKAGLDDRVRLVVDAGNRNWMAPDSYIYGLGLLADRLSERFPEDKGEIARRKEDAIRRVRQETGTLLQEIKQAGIFGKPVIASSMQKEPLECMGFRVVGEYGRPEAMSAKDVVELARIGRDRRAIMIVDNLQSGPDAGRGIAETLKVSHVVLTNFPSEKGYLTTLGENVNILLAAVRK